MLSGACLKWKIASVLVSTSETWWYFLFQIPVVVLAKTKCLHPVAIHLVNDLPQFALETA